MPSNAYETYVNSLNCMMNSERMEITTYEGSTTPSVDSSAPQKPATL